jgi:hypothetical protein
MTETESTNPLEWFVDSLLQNAGQLMLIIDHMARYPSDDEDESSFDEVLRMLLTEALEPAYRRRDPGEFANAAALLAEARHAIGEELVLVEPGASGLNGEALCEPPATPSGGRRHRRRRR